MHRPALRWLALAFLILPCAMATHRADAQAVRPTPGAAPATTGAAAAGASAVSPAQAQQVLDVLRDDKRRAEMISVMDGIVRAQAAVPAPQPAPGTAAPAAGEAGVLTPAAASGTAATAATAAGATPAEAAKAAGPLAPDSLGAQLLVRVSAAVQAGAAKLGATVRSVNDLPLLVYWLRSLGADPASRARLGDAAWKMALVVGLALAAEWVAVRALRRVRKGLARRAPETAVTPDPVEDSGLAAAEAGETEHSRHRLPLTIAWHALRRLPLVLGAFVLDLVPLVVVAGVGNALMGTRLGQPVTVQLVILAVVEAYVVCRIALAVVRMLLSPKEPRLRLLAVSDGGAAFLTSWARRIVIIGVAGYALAEVGLLFGLYRAAHDTVLKLVALAIHVCLVIVVLRSHGAVARRLRAPKASKGTWAMVRNRFAESWHVLAIFLIVAIWLVWAVELRDGPTRLMRFILVTTAVLVASRLLAILLLGAVDRLFRISADAAARYPGLESRATTYYPFLRGVLDVVIGVATLLALLEVWGLGVLDWFSYGGLGTRTVQALGLIGVTVLMAVLAWEGANIGIERYLVRLSAEANLARAARLRTLLPMMRTALMVTILAVVLLTALSELGLNIAPLLAGAGVIGIALGFGSQKLVQDLITGLFLLLENAVQVGDVVTLGGLSGTVEALSIRTIRLRALDGSVHIIPFSAVTTVTNQTRDFAYAVLDVSAGLNEEPDYIAEVLRETAKTMAQEPRWSPLLLGELEVLGVDKFLDNAWVMRCRLKTLPASRWPVGREMNRRIKMRFDELAIESPFTSHRVLSTVPGPLPVPAPAAVDEAPSPA